MNEEQKLATRKEPLVDSLRSRDSDARNASFRELYDQVGPRLLTVLVHLLGNHEDAQDVLQETFIVAYRGIGQFRGESSVSTWMHRIAVRIAIRAKARRTKRPVVGLSVDSLRPEWKDEKRTYEVMEAITVALGRLPLHHRLVLSLFAIEGHSHDEIAAILGIPVGTVLWVPEILAGPFRIFWPVPPGVAGAA